MGQRRKTRKEKIITQLRRELAKKEGKPVQSKKKEIAKKEINIAKQDFKKNNFYLIADLRRTGIFSLLAISLELMLYWLWEKNNLLNLKAILGRNF